jgi:glycerol kinase
MLTTVGWTLNGKTSYALEGSAFIAGAAVQWLRDGLGIIKDAADIEEMASSVDDSGGVVFVPALAGLGAPHWRPHARGIIRGITGGTTSAHLCRAALEGIALQIDDILKAMSNDLGAPMTELRVDGGAARNNLLMQLQTDLLDLPCVRPKVLETTGLGSALLAGLAVGFWTSAEEVSKTWAEEARFEPKVDSSQLDSLRASWKEAIERA